MAQNSLNDLNTFLNAYVQAVDKDTDLAAKEAAQTATKYLKSVSPTKTGSYAKGWTWKKVNGTYIVHNRTDYQLTHLLEKGHDIVAYGKKVGHVSAKPHIKDAEELAASTFEKELKEKIENEH